MSRRTRRATSAATVTLALALAAVALPARAGAGGSAAENGFSAPVQLRDSYGTNEPSIVAGGDGRIYVTGPQGSLSSVSGSPVWRSDDGGATFEGPVRAIGDPRHGSDSDLAIDARGDVYQADLWLGNVAMALSTDGGQSFVANEWGNAKALADRPWLAYSPHDNVLYDFYNGIDALHLSRTLPLTTPEAGLTFPVDLPVATECSALTPTCTTPGLDTHCTCPPGGIDTDPATGRVYVTYGSERGVVVATSTDEGLSWARTAIPGSGSFDNGWTVSYNFQPVKVDAEGNVYVAWAEAQDPAIDADGNVAAPGGVAVRFSRSADHGATWSSPVTVSTTTGSNVFPTLTLGPPGVAYVGYYGTIEPVDPGYAPDSASWDLMVSTSRNALSDSPDFEPEVAVAGIHTGCVNVLHPGCLGTVNGNGLGDFFSMATAPDGTLLVAYVAGTTGDTRSTIQVGAFSTSSSTTFVDAYIYVTSRPGRAPGT